MKTYHVTDIFHSIQGEGMYSGTPAIFIRFAGCNLACPFCDTDFTKKFDMHCDDIIDSVVSKSARTRFVVITGGEPLMQVTQSLTDRLSTLGYKIALETNGTIEIESVFPRNPFNWVTVSPKHEANDERWEQRWGDELKVLFSGQSADSINAYIHNSNFRYYTLQPRSDWLYNQYGDEIHRSMVGAPDPHRVAELVRFAQCNPHWRLSLQLHKVLGVQ